MSTITGKPAPAGRPYSTFTSDGDGNLTAGILHTRGHAVEFREAADARAWIAELERIETALAARSRVALLRADMPERFPAGVA